MSMVKRFITPHRWIFIAHATVTSGLIMAPIETFQFTDGWTYPINPINPMKLDLFMVWFGDKLAGSGYGELDHFTQIPPS